MKGSAVTGGAAVLATIVATLLTLQGCHGGPGQPAPGPSPSAATPPTVPSPAASTTAAGTTRVTITAAHPVARLPQDPAPRARLVRVELPAVANPGGQGLTITVAVEAARGAPVRPIEVGRVSLFPPDRGGVFTLPLPDAAANLVRTAPSVLTVGADPIVPDAPLRTDVRLTLAVALTG